MVLLRPYVSLEQHFYTMADTDPGIQSTAYLITKVSDPPPPPSQSREFAAREVEWRNKHEFLKLSLANLDTLQDKPPPYQPTDPFPRSASQ
jgi:hypothetical protein